MGDCKEKGGKATRKSISLETKMQMLRRLDAGERQSDIGTALNLSTSTIRTTTSATKITRSRNNVIEEMEKRLFIWIDDEVERNMPLSEAIIMEKARTIFNHIQNEKGDTSENFVASRGWFYRFKNRNNLHNIQITGEAASGDTKAVAAFPATLRAIIERGNYPPELVFNMKNIVMKRAFLEKNAQAYFYSVNKSKHQNLKLQKIV